MNTFGTGLTFVTTLLAGALFGSSLILQSDTPLPLGLESAVERELDLAGLWQHPQVDVYVRIHGACRVSSLPPGDIHSPLGWVDKVDGEMLSIIHVDCLRIGQALWRIVADPRSAGTREIMARAIARVIRHEFRHLTLNTAEHERQGDYKASLRAEELAAPFMAVPLR
jgi:hypothetical protein